MEKIFLESKDLKCGRRDGALKISNSSIIYQGGLIPVRDVARVDMSVQREHKIAFFWCEKGIWLVLVCGFLNSIMVQAAGAGTFAFLGQWIIIYAAWKFVAIINQDFANQKFKHLLVIDKNTKSHAIYTYTDYQPYRWPLPFRSKLSNIRWYEGLDRYRTRQSEHEKDIEKIKMAISEAIGSK